MSSFVLAIILAVAYFSGYVSWYFMIGLLVLFNIIVWLVGPYVNDLIYKWFYKIRFYEYEEIKDKPYMLFVKKICDEHNIKVPKIGIINDKNPTAFTYGSASFNARIVLTDGLFEFLDEDELKAVIAHELGHIINKDFIIMTIATTLLQVLYFAYVIFAKYKTRKTVALGKKGEKKSGNYFVVIGYVSYLFYWIGTYLLLYLSRLREYYADEFSAKKTGDPNLLSSALIKIAYGISISPDTPKTANLLNATRAQGIFDVKTANEVGLVYHNARDDKELMKRSLLFDLYNPWAWILQLKSTHPLVGKRIERLCSMTNSPLFNFYELKDIVIDKSLLWKNFFRDVFVKYSITLMFLIILVLTILQFLGKGNFLVAIAVAFVLLIIFSFINVRYRYPLDEFNDTTILDCMADVYASPIRGKPVKIAGKAIGRGQAGFIFGEDMMFQDKSGIIYLNYESGIPLFGNLIFAWKKLKELLMKPAITTGWFLRGVTHHIELHRFHAGETTIKSRVRLWFVLGIIMKVLLIGLLLLLFYFIYAGRFL